MESKLKSIKILVADDEALARKRIVRFLSESAYPITILEASNGKETIVSLMNDLPDLVFLDIKMTDMTSFDVLNKIPTQNIPIIIFVTAFNSFAVKAFEVRAIDFLLKPYKKERFFKALNRGIEQLEMTNKKSFQLKVSELMQDFQTKKWEDKKEPNYLEQIVLKLNKKYYFVKTKDIKYIKSSGYYAEIFTGDKKKHLYRISMTDFLLKLDPEHFSRINRSVIINKKQIKELINEGLGDFSVILKDGNSFAVTKHYKQDFLLKMGIKK